MISLKKQYTIISSIKIHYWHVVLLAERIPICFLFLVAYQLASFIKGVACSKNSQIHEHVSLYLRYLNTFMNSRDHVAKIYVHSLPSESVL
jgi:hypothetical protein